MYSINEKPFLLHMYSEFMRKQQNKEDGLEADTTDL
jgi:hypothetical protein